jgi:hypothetical protein
MTYYYGYKCVEQYKIISENFPINFITFFLEKKNYYYIINVEQAQRFLVASLQHWLPCHTTTGRGCCRQHGTAGPFYVGPITTRKKNKTFNNVKTFANTRVRLAFLCRVIGRVVHGSIAVHPNQQQQ